MTFPPGRARLGTSPLVTGSPAAGKTIGEFLDRLLGRQGSDCASGHDDIDLERNQFGRKGGEALGLSLGITIFDHDVAALDVTEVTQFFKEGLLQVGIGGQVGRQEAYSSDLGRLLSFGGERHGQGPQREPLPERAPLHHWMISSARTRIDCGIVSPSAFAVFRLMAKWNRLTCSIGRSPGAAPSRTSRTYLAAYRPSV